MEYFAYAGIQEISLHCSASAHREFYVSMHGTKIIAYDGPAGYRVTKNMERSSNYPPDPPRRPVGVACAVFVLEDGRWTILNGVLCLVCTYHGKWFASSRPVASDRAKYDGT